MTQTHESPLAMFSQTDRYLTPKIDSILSEEQLVEMEIWAERAMAKRQEPRKPPTTWKALAELVMVYNLDLHELQHADNDLKARMTPQRISWFAQVMRYSILMRANILASPVFSWAEWREGELTTAQDRLSDVGASDLRFLERV